MNNNRLDFGSMLRFVEQNFSVGDGALGFADARAAHDLAPFFNLTQTARPFHMIPARETAEQILRDKTPVSGPDDD